MTKSETISSLAKALGLFHVKIEKVKKENTNPFFHSKYASLSTILDAIDLPLTETGLVFSQHPSGVNELTTILIHSESGEYFESTYTMPVSAQNSPQAVGSAITYARRYALGAILGLNIEDDDDANKANNNNGNGAVNNKTTQIPASNGKTETEKQWLNPKTNTWTEAVMALRNGTVTLDQVKKKYAISKVNQDLLNNEINQPA